MSAYVKSRQYSKHLLKSIAQTLPNVISVPQTSTFSNSYQMARCYCHGDINPQNILFDYNDQIKLIDFDHSLKVGDELDVGYEPYVRQHREPAGGLFGAAGPVTEQFALGSVFWYMTRGSQLYSELEGPDQVDRLLDGIFPLTDPHDPIDGIIRNCWNGYYPKIANLVDDIQIISGSTLQTQIEETPSQRQERRMLCEEYYKRANPSPI
ncbi:hypothetical protein MY8738_001732 [Beauveria namnaoensis]